MTCTEDLGTLSVKLEYVSLGYRGRVVDLEIIWISCGVYQVSYRRPKNAAAPMVLGTSGEWYPANVNICFTPEQFNAAFDLFEAAPKQDRENCYKPYYENYDLDRGMFDMGYDTLFQAFKDPKKDKVHLVTHTFRQGTPGQSCGENVLGLYLEDFKRLKEFIDSKSDWIFYSGVKIGNSGVEAAWVETPAQHKARNESTRTDREVAEDQS